ncbi:cuticle protein 8-like [Homarus americanus]|uniref:cuticle protein 8-like n=1 Tax=Homarus americanus TaxID=6706 RepID=UPI001C4869D0|nr:cuticle protein 8-like isoform X2 [Homarus americanus]XP_042242118.1 cuticle protein 8-like [Homarus americanus]
MNSKVLLLLGVVSLAAADNRPSYSYAAPHGSSEESYESSEAQYNFNYAVEHDPSGNDFGHQETRDGDNTQGSYYVQLPDGRRQTVTYFVDGDSGYIADVKYDGEARYPDSFESREAPRYTPPRPSFSRSFESFESREAPRFAPHRSSFPSSFESSSSFESPNSFESFESLEATRYGPPRRVYG